MILKEDIGNVIIHQIISDDVLSIKEVKPNEYKTRIQG